MRPSDPASEATIRAESDPIMPASRDGDVQTNKTDSRKFITIRVASNGRVAYNRIYLKTTNHRLARRRARALESIENPEQARRIVTYLASAKTTRQQNDRLAELTDTTPTIPSLSHDDARKELESIVCDFGDYAPGEIDDEVVDRWRGACSANDQRDLLINLGIPEDYLAENPDLFTSLHSCGRAINPRYKPQHQAIAALFGLPADALKRNTLARGPRLSACIAEFRIEQKQRGNPEIQDHGRDGSRSFRWLHSRGRRPTCRAWQLSTLGGESPCAVASKWVRQEMESDYLDASFPRLFGFPPVLNTPSHRRALRSSPGLPSRITADHRPDVPKK